MTAKSPSSPATERQAPTGVHPYITDFRAVDIPDVLPEIETSKKVVELSSKPVSKPESAQTQIREIEEENKTRHRRRQTLAGISSNAGLAFDHGDFKFFKQTLLQSDSVDDFALHSSMTMKHLPIKKKIQPQVRMFDKPSSKPTSGRASGVTTPNVLEKADPISVKKRKTVHINHKKNGLLLSEQLMKRRGTMIMPVPSKLLPPGSSSTFRASSNQDLEEFVKLESNKITEKNSAGSESRVIKMISRAPSTILESPFDANDTIRPSQMDAASLKEHMTRQLTQKEEE